MKNYKVFHFDGDPDTVRGRLIGHDVNAHEATFITSSGLITFDNVSSVEVLP